MSHQWALVARRGNSFWDCIGHWAASRLRKGSCTSVQHCWATFGACGPVLGSLIHETHGHSGTSPGKAPWRCLGDWNICHIGRIESWDCSAWRRGGSGGPHCCVQVSERRLQGGCSQALPSGPQWWEERQWAQAKIQEILFKHEREGKVSIVRVLKLWQSYPERLWSLHLCKCSRSIQSPQKPVPGGPALNSLQGALKLQLLCGYTK